jgi:hypothetical protein
LRIFIISDVDIVPRIFYRCNVILPPPVPPGNGGTKPATALRNNSVKNWTDRKNRTALKPATIPINMPMSVHFSEYENSNNPKSDKEGYFLLMRI